MIKVMIIDDQTLFREGLKAILEQNQEYQVLGLLEKGVQVIEEIQQDGVHPEVILISLQLPNREAIRTIKYIKDNFPDIKIITLIESIDEEKIVNAIIVGADGFLLKQHYAEKLLQSIQDVLVGDTVISGSIATMLANRIRALSMDEKVILGKRLEQNGFYFTNRELDVAYLLQKGHTNHEIAIELSLGEGTVKNYISEIYNKLNIRIRNQVIQYLRELSEFTKN